MQKIKTIAAKHRVVTGLLLTAVIGVVLGHHELSWLLIAVNYDKILTAVLNS